MKKSIIVDFSSGTPSSTYSVATGYSVGSEWVNTDNGNRFYHKTDGNWVQLDSSSFYIQGGATYSFDTTSSIYRTGPLNIGTGTATDGRFVASSTGGTVSLVVDESGNVYNNSRGSANTLFGYRALYSNTAMGYSNTAFGRLSLYSNIDGNSNTAVGLSSLYGNTYGNYNTAVGLSSLYFNTTGDMNTSIGAYSLSYNTLGNYNSAMGYNVLYNTTTTVTVLGTFSEGNGYTTGTYSDIQLIYATGSTALGYPSATIVVGVGGTISSVTLSTGNKGRGFKDTTTILTAATSSIGNGTGFTIRVSTILSGSSNTSIGHQSLYTNTSGSENVAIGFNSLFSNSTSSKNVAVGRNTLYYNSTGANNTAIGYYSSFNNTTGSDNTAIGYQSLYNSAVSSNNTAIGYQSLYSIIGDSSNNTAIGYHAGHYISGVLGVTLSNWSTYIGSYTRGYAYDTTHEVVIGASAIGNGSYSVTLGNDSITKTILKGNIGIGTTSPSTKLHVYATQSGAFRLQDGTQANGYVLTSDANGVASWTASVSGGGISGTGTTNYLPKFTGSTSLGNSTITDTGSIVNINSKLIIDTSLGVYTTKTGWDTFSTGFGYQALNNSTAIDGRNTAFGYRASSGNTTGGYNSSFGQFALFSSTQSMENTAVGAGSLAWLTTGDRNIGIGRNAGVGAGSSLVNMSESIFIGYLTTPANNGETNQIVIGNSQAGNGSNSVTLGNSSITKTILRGNIGVGLTGPSTKLHIYATQSGAFRLEDGTQGTGKVLISDANGVGSWTASISPTASYKVYRALLSQLTTSAPTAIVLENTLGVTVTYAYSITGEYIGTATGALTLNKTSFLFKNSNHGSPNFYTESIGRISTDLFVIGSQINGVFTDGILNQATIEIRVYN